MKWLFCRSLSCAPPMSLHSSSLNSVLSPRAAASFQLSSSHPTDGLSWPSILHLRPVAAGPSLRSIPGVHSPFSLRQTSTRAPFLKGRASGVSRSFCTSVRKSEGGRHMVLRPNTRCEARAMRVAGHGCITRSSRSSCAISLSDATVVSLLDKGASLCSLCRHISRSTAMSCWPARAAISAVALSFEGPIVRREPSILSEVRDWKTLICSSSACIVASR
mmetsp:Transcript_63487/g.125554  ORF Transcript_63487/g.125554 Transcript_63487/m.125554 type:complete len:219 (+) Transcript_63487:1402-2058(+)